MATIKSAGTSAVFPRRKLSQLVAYTYYTSAGRDKLLRVVQNLAGFLAWGLQRSSANTQRWSRLIASLTLVKKNLGLTAKLTRGSGILALFQFAANTTKSQGKDKIPQHLLVGKLLSYGVFAMLDLLCYVSLFSSARLRDCFEDKLTELLQTDAVGIITLPKAAAVQRKAHKAWLCGVIFSTISALHRLIEFRKRQQTNAVEFSDQVEEIFLEEWVPFRVIVRSKT
jgi:hypothetical protein